MHKIVEGRKAPIIGDNVDIGANVAIIGPVSVGDNVIIGAGSIVVKDISSNKIAVGNPAREVKNNLFDNSKIK